MEKENRHKEALLRTYDLPDIHFSEVTVRNGAGNTFRALRCPGKDDLDSLALNLWYEESRPAAVARSRRDCWLQVEDKIYVVWGAVIISRRRVDKSGEPLEQWEFGFDEMSSYRPCPN